MTQKRGPYKAGIESRKRILDAAILAFGKRGYHRATLREIGETTGVSPASIAQLFGSKQALFLSVMEKWTENTQRIISERSFGIDYFDGLREAMAYNVQNPGLIELHVALCAEANDPDHPAHEYMTRRYRTIVPNVAGHLLEAAAAGDIAPLSVDDAHTEATHIVAAMDGLQIQWLLLPDIDVAQRFDQYIERTIRRLQTSEIELGAPQPAAGTAN